MRWRKIWEGTVKVLSHLDLVASVLVVIPGLKTYALVAKALDVAFDWEAARLAHERAKKKIEDKK